jgi:hypothetical protein
MPVTYTNRKGRTYFLCQGTTKTGKPRYYFTREPNATLAQSIPEGYEIRESVNGIVSLPKARPALLADKEINAVKTRLHSHPKARRYRVDVKSKQIIIYECVGPDLMEWAVKIAADFGMGEAVDGKMARRIQEEERVYAQFTPIMRFTLTDNVGRLFAAERMCYLGSIDDWIAVAINKPITKFASEWIPRLGTDKFFELFRNSRRRRGPTMASSGLGVTRLQ